MEHGWEDGKFYVEYHGVDRPVGNMREESDRRAKDIAEGGGNIIVCNSGGLDSQSVIQSFRDIDCPIDTVFLYLPGYNDHELEQIKFIDNKYQIKTEIVDLDPFALKDDIEKLSVEYDVSSKNQILQSIFVSKLPKDSHVVQLISHPVCLPLADYTKLVFYAGYYVEEISRERAFSKLNRTGKNIFFGNTYKYLLSILQDDTFKGAVESARYFDGNKLFSNERSASPQSVDRWDYYIKPIIYGKYWGDTLTYFPKSNGFENIDFLKGNPVYRKHACIILYHELLDILKTPGAIKRVYENVKFIPT
jgi:hypothetical protein